MAKYTITVLHEIFGVNKVDKFECSSFDRGDNILTLYEEDGKIKLFPYWRIHAVEIEENKR